MAPLVGSPWPALDLPGMPRDPYIRDKFHLGDLFPRPAAGAGILSALPEGSISRGAEGKFNCGPCERGAACLQCGAVRDRTARGRLVIFQCKL
jgi:hypothetical protein